MVNKFRMTSILHWKSDVMEKCSHSVDIIIYNQSTVEFDM